MVRVLLGGALLLLMLSGCFAQNEDTDGPRWAHGQALQIDESNLNEGDWILFEFMAEDDIALDIAVTQLTPASNANGGCFITSVDDHLELTVIDGTSVSVYASLASDSAIADTSMVQDDFVFTSASSASLTKGDSHLVLFGVGDAQEHLASGGSTHASFSVSGGQGQMKWREVARGSMTCINALEKYDFGSYAVIGPAEAITGLEVAIRLDHGGVIWPMFAGELGYSFEIRSENGSLVARGNSAEFGQPYDAPAFPVPRGDYLIEASHVRGYDLVWHRIVAIDMQPEYGTRVLNGLADWN